MEHKLTIGHVAFDWLQNTVNATVQGITSKGVFLSLRDGEVIFFSDSIDFGPLNLLSSGKVPNYWRLHDSISVNLQVDSLALSTAQRCEIFANYQIWQIPPPPGYHITNAEQHKRMKQAVSQVRLLKTDDGFSPMLPHLLNPLATSLSANLLPAWQIIHNLAFNLPHDDIARISQCVIPLLGFGRGLTPSGDDFISGFLFLLNRFPPPNLPVDWLKTLNQNLLSAAAESTNAVSRSLLFCATTGSADHRLQRCADWLMNAEISFENQPLELARWGSSSGADFLAGMITAIQFRAKFPER